MFKKIIGAVLVSIPFLVLFAITASAVGFFKALAIFVITLISLACIGFGVYFLNKEK